MRLRLLFSESIRSLGANLSTTIAATMTVLIGMFLLGLFIALGSWVVSWSDHVKRELMVKVFFVENANEKQFNTIRDAARGRSARQGRTSSSPRPTRSSGCARSSRS